MQVTHVPRGVIGRISSLPPIIPARYFMMCRPIP